MKRENNGRNERRTGLTLMLSLALVCMMALYGGTVSGLFEANAPAIAEATGEAASEPAADPSPAIYVAEKNANSVVGVLTNDQQWDRSTGQVKVETVAQGSGVVIAEGGYILTNYHVIESGTSYQILMPSGDKVDATVAGADSSTDLAVLKVSEGADQLTPVAIGSSENLKVGSTVVAIGNPGGEVLANTVTQGVVSALERTSVTSSNTSRRINYIQHDASINNGNSGGGLFNYKGELVGINTLKYSGSAYSSVSFEGLGFAIPVDTAYDVATQLIENGKVIRPGLGVTVSDYTDGPDEPLANNAPQSVVIGSVNEGGAADKAGLKQYDFIYEVDGQRITSMLDLTSILDEHEAGDTISVTVVRYNQAGVYQGSGMSSLYGYGFGYGYGYGYGKDGSDDDSSDSNVASGQIVVGGGFEKITVDVTLENLAN